jgi:hypothetical protein
MRQPQSASDDLLSISFAFSALVSSTDVENNLRT